MRIIRSNVCTASPSMRAWICKSRRCTASSWSPRPKNAISASPKPGETRLDLVKKNIRIFGFIMPELKKRDIGGVLVIVANPVDVLTYAAIQMVLCIPVLWSGRRFYIRGIPALLRVLRDYAGKYRRTGNVKYAAALKKCIIPAFQEILNDVIRGMADDEKDAVRKLIEEGLDE